MILGGFAALNESSNSSSTTSSREGRSTANAAETTSLDLCALEEQCHALYNQGLVQFGKKDYVSSRNLFRRVLHLLEKFPRKISSNDPGAFGDGEVAAKLRFNALKYSGLCFGREASPNHEKSMEFLVQAVKLDSSDVSLCFALGACACRCQKLSLGRAALEQALKASPKHFPSLELLVSLTHKLGDEQTSLLYIEQLLRINPRHQKAVKLRDEILSHHLNMGIDFRSLCPSILRIPVSLPILDSSKLSSVEWPTLVQPTKAKRKRREAAQIRLKGTSFLQLFGSLARQYKNTSDEKIEGICKLVLEVNVEGAVKEIVEELIERALSRQDIVMEEVSTPEPNEAESVVAFIIDDIISDIVQGTDARFMKQILLDVLDAVVEFSESSSLGSGTSTRRSCNKGASFLSEVPLDLMEIRRSSRKREALDAWESDNSKLDDVTTLSLLESFIPSFLREKEANGRDSRQSKSPDALEKDQAKELVARPWFSVDSESEQVGDLLESIATSSKSIVDLLYSSLLKLGSLEGDRIWPDDVQDAFLECFLLWRPYFSLPDEFSGPAPSYDYVNILLTAYEIVCRKAAEAKTEKVAVPKEDLLHFRLSFARLSRQQLLRVYFLHFTVYQLERKKEEATWSGDALKALLAEDQTCSEVDQLCSPVLQYRVGIAQLEKSMSALEFLRVEHNVQTLFEDEQFERVVDILTQTLSEPEFQAKAEGDEEDFEAWYQKMAILIESLQNLGRFADSLSQCELALRKRVQSCTYNDRERTIEEESEVNASVLSLLAYVEFNLSRCEDGACAEVLSGLCHSLVKVLSVQIGSEGLRSTKSLLPWTLFYRIVAGEEERKRAAVKDVDEDGLPKSVGFLVSAHEYLGQMSSCTDQSGKMLHELVDAAMAFLQRRHASALPDSLRRALDQALYCLYSHPSKKTKSKHLVDHGVSPLALTWDRCSALCRLFRPRKMPEFDDFKSNSISVETEALFKRFYALVPDSFDLNGRKVAMRKWLGDPGSRMPTFRESAALPKSMRDLFYLLADYLFKNSDFGPACDMFLVDLSFNATRLDSWVALALSLSSKIEERLNKNEQSDTRAILQESGEVFACYRMSMEREIEDMRNATVFIESANFAYTLHSYCSRLLKVNSDHLGLELFELVEKKRGEFLAFADAHYAKAFEMLDRIQVTDDSTVDERWLLHFMRGKIMEKRSEDLESVFAEYTKAIENLLGQGAAKISKRIVYNNPQEFSLELLELYYRVHATVLKLGHEVRELSESEAEAREAECGKLLGHLEKVQRMNIFGATAKGLQRNDSNPTGKTGDDSSNLEAATAEKASPAEEGHVVHAVVGESKSNWDKAAAICIAALERIVSVFPQHFRSLQLLGSYFLPRDLAKARMHLLTLFGERKNNNFFNGIWRSPMHEFDRAGSFSGHVSKCVSALFEMASRTEDSGVLLDATCQLKKPPEGERQYLFEHDRKAFATEAYTLLLGVFRKKGRSDRLVNETMDGRINFCIELYNAYNKLRRSGYKADETVKSLLVEVYSALCGKPSVMTSFDEATTFCMRMLQWEKSGWKNKSAGEASISPFALSRSTSQEQLDFAREMLAPTPSPSTHPANTSASVHSAASAASAHSALVAGLPSSISIFSVPVASSPASSSTAPPPAPPSVPKPPSSAALENAPPQTSENKPLPKLTPPTDNPQNEEEDDVILND